MTETAIFLKLVESIGFPAVIFIIWFLYHKSQTKLYEELLKAQAKREERNFNILKEMLETNQYNAAVLSRIEQKIDANAFCPIVKEKQR